MISIATDLTILFAAACLAATILPAQSEAVLSGLYLSGHHSAVMLVIVATAGNVLGACINWLIGRYLLIFQDRSWFPVSAQALDRATQHYQRYGVWTLLLAWVPIIGDPLTLIAGVMRTHIGLFFLLVTIGKAGRYIALVFALSSL